MHLPLTKSFIVLIIFCFCISCKTRTKENPIENTETPELGTISINISCSEEASDVFKEGLLLLHSFEFEDAGEKFLEAQQIDSTCAMAYWGEAMSHNHPLWREQDKAAAMDILERLGTTTEAQRLAFKTEFEQDMFDAISILYGPDSKKENDKAYAAFMENLYNKYPGNHEVHAFYALSLLGAVEDDRSEDLYNKGARIAQSIIDENPNHPGALHYLIHSYDDPVNAHKALHAADRYASVAPDASHALHMPSHIYVALGRWDEVINSNIAAVAASIERKERKDLGNDAIDYHSLKWQMYGHLQKAEYDKARSLVEQMEAYCEEESSILSLAHVIMMKGAFLSETNSWDDPLIQDSIDYNDIPVQILGTRNYILGMEAYASGNLDSLCNLIDGMKNPIAEAEKEAMMGSVAMCSGNYDRLRPTMNHVKRLKVVEHQLKAQLAMMNNDHAEAESLIKSAIELEESTTYQYGPPEVVKPSHEMYADWLMEQDRKEEALVHYQKVLERAPGRLISSKAIETIQGKML